MFNPSNIYQAFEDQLIVDAEFDDYAWELSNKLYQQRFNPNPETDWNDTGYCEPLERWHDRAYRF